MNLFADLHQLHLLRPWWLLAMLPALLLTFLLWRRRSSGGEWTRAIAPELLQPLLEQSAAPATRRWLPLLLGGWLLAALALSGPAWQQLPQPVMQRSDALVIVLDLSLSMLTEDITPSRLQRARYKIQDVLAQRHEGTTALVAYAGSAHVVAPLTEDAATLANLLPALTPETMPLRGSDPAAAIELAIELLQGAGEQRGRILLVSDGIRERDVDAITALLDRRWQLSILGIGTLQGAPLPLDDGFARESDGSIAVPRLSREQFETLAQRSDGRYRELHADNSDIDALLATSALDLDATRRTGDTRQFDQWQDRGALLALLLLPLAALLFRRGWLLLLPLLLLPLPLTLTLTLLPASHAEAQAAEQAQSEAQPTTGRIEKLWRELWLRPDQQAARAFDAGDAARAAQQFEDPRWRGAARYRAGDFAGAASDFAAGDNEATDGTADYNRGNALARAGKLQEALQAYDSALQANPQFDDASFNRALVEKLQQQQSQQSSQSPSEQQPQPPSQGQSQEQSGQQSQQRSQQQSQQDEESSAAAQQGQSSNQAEPSNSADREPSSDAASNQQKAQESAQQQRDEQQAGAQTDRDATSQPEQEGNDQNPASSAQAQAGEQEAEQSSQTEAQADTLQQQREAARTEQWLRQIPDDPGGLLQRKFLYEQRLRERDGETRAAGQPAW